MTTGKITKLLSANDTGETGGHQAGILVPKDSDILSFFPDVGCEEKNPRVELQFEDRSGIKWKFHFIYYNNKFFDERGTRNEYRLTGMTKYFKENGLHAGDTMILSRNDDGQYLIDYERADTKGVEKTVNNDGTTTTRLVLGGGWKVIDY